METKKLTAESTPIFQEGIGLILSRWSALTAAVENEWGGHDSNLKANCLCSDVISFFTKSRVSAEPLYIDDLENILEEGLLSLNTLVEDGSIEEVAEKLMIMHEECLEGDFQSVEKLRTTNPPPVAHVGPYTDEDEDEDDDEDDSMDACDATNMIVDVPNSQSSLTPVSMPTDEPKPNQAAEAEDGWVVVSSRRNKGRRN